LKYNFDKPQVYDSFVTFVAFFEFRLSFNGKVASFAP